MKQNVRHTRHNRIRTRVKGTAQRPRAAVYRSARHVYVQLIDDEKGVTLACASSNAKIKGTKTEQSAEVGRLIAQAAKEVGIKAVVFDRGGYKYHGRVKALADAMRESNLEF